MSSSTSGSWSGSVAVFIAGVVELGKLCSLLFMKSMMSRFLTILPALLASDMKSDNRSLMLGWMFCIIVSRTMVFVIALAVISSALYSCEILCHRSKSSRTETKLILASLPKNHLSTNQPNAVPGRHGAGI